VKQTKSIQSVPKAAIPMHAVQGPLIEIMELCRIGSDFMDGDKDPGEVHAMMKAIFPRIDQLAEGMIAER